MNGEATLVSLGDGRCAVKGALTFESAPGLWRELTRSGVLASAVSADLSGVSASDSAGLALLVAWRAARRKSGGDVHFLSLPERLAALARLTDAGALLDA